MQLAYDYFNEHLFGGALPSCLITLRTHGKARAYFSLNRFEHLQRGDATYEIALDARHFANRTALEVLSTLVHEMVHLRQAEEGKPSRNGYHNRQWVQMMAEVGLIASDTGRPGGKQTGQAMTTTSSPAVGSSGRRPSCSTRASSCWAGPIGPRSRPSVAVEVGRLGDVEVPVAHRRNRASRADEPSSSAPTARPQPGARTPSTSSCGDCGEPMRATTPERLARARLPAVASYSCKKSVRAAVVGPDPGTD